METQTELSRQAYEVKRAKDATQTFVTGPQVQERYHKSHVTIWRWIRDMEMAFPQPLKINRLNLLALVRSGSVGSRAGKKHHSIRNPPAGSADG